MEKRKGKMTESHAYVANMLREIPNWLCYHTIHVQHGKAVRKQLGQVPKVPTKVRLDILRVCLDGAGVCMILVTAQEGIKTGYLSF